MPRPACGALAVASATETRRKAKGADRSVEGPVSPDEKPADLDVTADEDGLGSAGGAAPARRLIQALLAQRSRLEQPNFKGQIIVVRRAGRLERRSHAGFGRASSSPVHVRFAALAASTAGSVPYGASRSWC
jgi:hypothetical protein